MPWPAILLLRLSWQETVLFYSRADQHIHYFPDHLVRIVAERLDFGIVSFVSDLTALDRFPVP